MWRAEGNCVGYGVATPVVIKNSIFWDVRPRSPLNIKGYFGGTWSCPSSGLKRKPSKKLP
jgi:hypothetical protein